MSIESTGMQKGQTFGRQKGIKFNNISSYFHKNRKKILAVVSQVLDSGAFLNGRQNRKLQENLNKFLKISHSIVCASGHDALLLALASLKLRPDDEVICPANAYPTAFAVAQSGARLVLCDNDSNGQIDPESLIKNISPKTKAVVMVHLYGLVGQIEKVRKISKIRKIILIEDCAQAFGSTYKGKQVGTVGDIGCFSFYPTKNIGTIGDGGAVVSKSKKRKRFLEQAVSYGEDRKNYSLFVSGHSRMPEVQVGVLNALWDDSIKSLKERKKLSQYYRRGILMSGLSKYIELLHSNLHSSAVEHLFVVKAYNRDKLRKYLENESIETAIHFPVPVHMLPAFAYLKYKKGSFFNSELLSGKVLSLPFYPGLLKREIGVIIQTIKRFYAQKNPSGSS